jgi:hypothetical protein
VIAALVLLTLPLAWKLSPMLDKQADAATT